MVTDIKSAASGSPSMRPRAARIQKAARAFNLPGEDRLRLIAEAAYFRAERRSFGPGRELEDWLAAEIEVDALLGNDSDDLQHPAQPA